jgi:hypothetical protein
VLTTPRRERSRLRSTGSIQMLRTGPLIVWYQIPPRL